MGDHQTNHKESQTVGSQSDKVVNLSVWLFQTRTKKIQNLSSEDLVAKIKILNMAANLSWQKLVIKRRISKLYQHFQELRLTT